jgi:ATP-dependent DNA helicase RecG
MKTVPEICKTLDRLNERCADEYEDQDLDFKEWNLKSRNDAVDLLIEMAVCMANGGGGTVVFGVNDKAVGRKGAVLGVPLEIDENLLKKAVYDRTDPKITPVFESMAVPEGTGRVLVMQVYPGMPPYTDTAGRGKIRIGKDCQPLTGTLRRQVMVETGETDFTASLIPEEARTLLSASAVEQLREAARKEHAPAELLHLSTEEFLTALGVTREGKITRGGVLLVGTAVAIERYIPRYVWTFLRMRGDTEYTERLDGREALPVAIHRLLDRVQTGNPITTASQGPFHFEYRTYPEIALRETLMNAFCHADFRFASPILVKQYEDRIEISNPGGFIGGITPSNILHHRPEARNPHLVDVLTRLRLVNRSHLGISRIYAAFLIEGKDPPIYEQRGDGVTLTLLARPLSVPFRAFVAEEAEHGRIPRVDQLLLLYYLLRHPFIDISTATRLMQMSPDRAKEACDGLVGLYLERSGEGEATAYTLRLQLSERLLKAGQPERDPRSTWEAAKARVLHALQQREHGGEPGLANADIRQLTHLDRHQVVRLMRALMKEQPPIRVVGERRYARYEYQS